LLLNDNANFDHALIYLAIFYQVHTLSIIIPCINSWFESGE